jgi:hypothetical protein
MIAKLFINGASNDNYQKLLIKILIFSSTSIGIVIVGTVIADLISRYFQIRTDYKSLAKSVFTTNIPIWIGILVAGILTIKIN